MNKNSLNKKISSTVTFLISAVSAGCVAYWGIQFSGAAATHTIKPDATFTAQINNTQLINKVLGAGQTVTTATTGISVSKTSDRYKLIGSVAGLSTGFALISIDGKAAATYRTGMEIEGGLIIKSVEPRSVTLVNKLNSADSSTIHLPKIEKI